MNVEVSQERVEAVLKGVTIPPRPALLVDVDQELRKPEPDLKRVAGLVGKDVGISAAMLKTLNSPLFALRSKVGSVPQAVQMLGARNIRSIITGLVLRSAVGGGASLDRFWESAERVAELSAYVCALIPKVPREEAFTLGLFHDCGIPILMQRFADYREALGQAASDPRPLTEFEDERYGTNHATVGYMMARSWGLADEVAQAILHHHDYHVFEEVSSLNALTKTLVAINRIAEHLNDVVLRMRQDHEWEKWGQLVLDYVGLSESEYSDLREDVAELYS